MKKLVFVALALFIFSAATVGATTVDFRGPNTGSIAGTNQGGFIFSSDWYRNSSGETPYMEYYDRPHSIQYAAGVFTFNSMSLSGFPWDNYNYVSGSGNLVFDFLDLSNTIIATRSIYLPRDNSFQSFVENISGVHAINFHATNGFWPRLESITLNDGAPVPEPSTLILLGAGLVGLGFARKRFAKN